MRLFLGAMIFLLSLGAQAQSYTLTSDALDARAMYAVIFIDGVQQVCIPVGTCSVSAPDVNGDKFIISTITTLVPPSLIFTVTARVCDASDVCSVDTVQAFDLNAPPPIAPPAGLDVTVN